MILCVYLKKLEFKFLKLIKQKGVHPYEYMNSFEKFFKINCLINVIFLVL